CSKVVIINKGKIALETSLVELNKKLDGDNEVHIKVANYSAEIKPKLNSLDSVQSTEDKGGGEFIVKSNSSDNTDEIARAIIDNNWGLKEIRPRSNTLEDVFLNVIASEQKQ
ncbi:MAG: hypothetical protein GWO07_01105, partial [Candidatus Dadabacteria bacterium]|nr:hypothetical protein [Candidatus Dadabacteria bacterium]NIS07374.1 hypothetical protein [Candidatus Dadabacteria bacterium]NIV41314.1 hypothetical protein [Candidatus Dadabacteria bacterium]NIY21011.1 hypothetical protein [Candidatus Dadabacteria bacterium]